MNRTQFNYNYGLHSFWAKITWVVLFTNVWNNCFSLSASLLTLCLVSRVENITHVCSIRVRPHTTGRFSRIMSLPCKLSRVSFHGFQHIGDHNYNIYQKAFWIITISGAIILLTFLSTNLRLPLFTYFITLWWHFCVQWWFPEYSHQYTGVRWSCQPEQSYISRHCHMQS